MIHARKQKAIAKAVVMAADHGAVQFTHAHILQMPVLVLNASYEPINICGARRALVLVLKGIARTEEEHGLTLHAQRTIIAMPSVIRLLEYRRIPHQTRALSRKNILLRDRNTCQYCGEALPPSELTLDHVVPRSRGGNSTWENLVACCHECNRRKGNRLLNEIDDMILLREPRPFSLHTSRQIMRMLGRSDDRWRKYLVLLSDCPLPPEQVSMVSQITSGGSHGIARRAGIKPAFALFAALGVLLAPNLAFARIFIGQNPGASSTPSQRLSFDVASIRQNAAGLDATSGNKPHSNFPIGSDDSYYPTGGVFSATNLPLISYIIFAYKITTNNRDALIASVPDWVLNDGYNIEARTDSKKCDQRPDAPDDAVASDRPF